MEDTEAAGLLEAGKPALCWGCGRELAAADNYCRYCGKGQGDYIPWYYRHWGIIVATLGLGPFSLFLVWRSPAISRYAKAAYTAALVMLAWVIYVQLRNAWMLMQSMMGQMQYL